MTPNSVLEGLFDFRYISSGMVERFLKAWQSVELVTF